MRARAQTYTHTHVEGGLRLFLAHNVFPLVSWLKRDRCFNNKIHTRKKKKHTTHTKDGPSDSTTVDAIEQMRAKLAAAQ